MRKCSKNEIFYLKTRLVYFQRVLLPRIAKTVEKAATQGDLTENADFLAAREIEKEIEEEIEELRAIIKSSFGISFSDFLMGHLIKFGSTVVLLEVATGLRQTWTIVTFMEEDLHLGKLAVDSDLAYDLLKKELFDSVIIDEKEFKVIEIIKPRHLFSKKKRLARYKNFDINKKRF